ncbi:MAG: helix-turn-helix domain-containing protein, partial [Lachnospiraceae bacterium]|nr:helix-turn-helix domain-containing protein [Lachnospiraceae bacterium]
EEALGILCISEFKGNVRELQNLIERAVVICDNNLIGREDLEDENDFLGAEFLNGEIYDELLENKLSLKAFESKYINYIFEKEGGSVKKICDILKIDRTTLWRKMKENQ